MLQFLAAYRRGITRHCVLQCTSFLGDCLVKSRNQFKNNAHKWWILCFLKLKTLRYNAHHLDQREPRLRSTLACTEQLKPTKTRTKVKSKTVSARGQECEQNLWVWVLCFAYNSLTLPKQISGFPCLHSNMHAHDVRHCQS